MPTARVLIFTQQHVGLPRRGVRRGSLALGEIPRQSLRSSGHNPDRDSDHEQADQPADNYDGLAQER